MTLAGEAAAELRGVDVAPAPGVRGAVLRGLTLRIAPGEQVAVIGASGAGKTTLLLALAAALPPLAGELRLLGEEPARLRGAALKRLRARLFLAPQVPPLPPRQRVVTAVLAARLPQLGLWRSLRMLWQPRLDDDEAGRAQAALAALQLPDKLWHRVDRLSGGERQRVGLARALVSDAALWLIDEPLSALDPARARGAIEALQQAARQGGRTLVCSLHQVALARECFARVLALRDGRLVYDGPASGLDDTRLAALYGAAGLADPTDMAESVANSASPAPAAGLPQTMCR